MTDEAAQYRMLSIAVRKFAGEPEMRAASTRHILRAAIALHAAYSTAADTALATAEALAPLAQAERRERKAG